MPTPRNWDEAAGILWPVLTGAAAERRLAIYSELSPLIQTNPLSVGWALGPIQTYCLENRLPPLTAIVVGKNSGVPGGGFVAWDIDDLEGAFEAVFRWDWTRTPNPFLAFTSGVTEASLAAQLTDNPDASVEVYRLVRDRGIAQRVFRRALLEAYGHSCCFCGLSFDQALQACHIVPWGESSHEERLDVRNGLLLCATHHNMFDAALIAVDQNSRIEYCDPGGEDGPYSEADRAASIQLHGQPARLPGNAKLRPKESFIQRRRVLDGWS